MHKEIELVVVADTLDGGAVLTMYDATDENDWKPLGQMAETVSSEPDEILEAYGWERTGEWFDDGDDFTASVKRRDPAMYVQTTDNYGETIVRVLGGADDEVLASFILEGDTLHSLSPREPRAEYVRMAEAHVTHNTQTK